ncbi:hypothetical protein [Flavobacterium hungaricum]|uniref:Spi protease inhibitor domain-containing protein n=1 Tax=Flavobacterium hungaricum TaxID=2082725 RepID=A0ABR9TDW5_9FLAO|nr:hypothetical protein [Flavobacterium hungaricum]MBE8723551.1 hypothetical protein [Flavobacterium hungaricum]
MIKIVTSLLLLFSFPLFSQTDPNGNPIFNSVTTGTEQIDDFELISNYYTLKNNIENKQSSVFVAEKPTLKEVENAALGLPSEFFVITKNQKAIAMIMMINQPRKYFVINPETGESKEFKSSANGDISENRAKELIENNYDPASKIEKNTLYFNNKKLKITSDKDIKEDVVSLIKKQKLNTDNGSSMKILSKEDLKNYIVTETKPGGKLDFFTEIKGHEYDGIQIKPGVFSTKLGIALYKWGRANFDLGTNTVEDALDFWTAIKEREANVREKEYIKLGFNKELEK